MNWWLSFADDVGFRGACVVPGEDIVEATKNAHRLGCNPGGEVVGAPIPPEYEETLPASMRGRILSQEECEQYMTQNNTSRSTPETRSGHTRAIDEHCNKKLSPS